MEWSQFIKITFFKSNKESAPWAKTCRHIIDQTQLSIITQPLHTIHRFFPINQSLHVRMVLYSCKFYPGLIQQFLYFTTTIFNSMFQGSDNVIFFKLVFYLVLWESWNTIVTRRRSSHFCKDRYKWKLTFPTLGRSSPNGIINLWGKKQNVKWKVKILLYYLQYKIVLIIKLVGPALGALALCAPVFLAYK